MHSLTGLTGSLVGIFIPAYLISLGHSPTTVFSFYLVSGISTFVFFLGAAMLARKTGVRIMVIASFPFTLTYIWLLYALHYVSISLPLLAILQGAGIGLYWFALHLFFASNAKEGKIGDSVGKLFGFPQTLGLLAPILGGLVAVRYGFPALFVLGGMFLLVALIPLFFIPELSVSASFNFKTFLSIFERFRRYTFIEFAENIRQELEAVVWPLFIFLVFRNALSVGFIGTLAAIGSILFTLAIGKYTDKINPKIFMRIGAVLMALIWLLRYALPTAPLLLYASTLAAGFLACLIEVPFASFVYTSAKQTNVAEFILYREFPVTLARIVIYSTALVIASVTNLFLVGAVVSVLILLF
ncbi:hypothetical protein HY091_02910 [Candidatus Kaiserbacteria bacterium]|nr:hypothetical protein [Candidatus Kaiserbacteria bacterium]